MMGEGVGGKSLSQRPSSTSATMKTAQPWNYDLRARPFVSGRGDKNLHLGRTEKGTICYQQSYDFELLVPPKNVYIASQFYLVGGVKCALSCSTWLRYGRPQGVARTDDSALS